MKNIKQNYQQIVKYLNNLFKKILFKTQNNTNSFFSKKTKIVKNLSYLFKNISLKTQNGTNRFFAKRFKVIKSLDYLIKTTLFKHRDKKNNIFTNKFNVSKIKISNFNKYLISLITLLFFYLFYLSTPILYDKSWVQINIEKKLINEFKINFSISSEISYEILPSPHFIIKNVKIFDNDINAPKALAEIKELEVFISQKKLLNKKKLRINYILINKANFSIQKSDLSFFKELFERKFSKKNIFIKNIINFLKNDNNETISIIKTPKILLSHDNLNSINQINLKGIIFNIPFNLTMDKEIFPSKILSKLNIDLKKLKIKLNNQSTNDLNEAADITNGFNVLSITNSKFNTKYNIKKNQINFKSVNSNIINSKVNYNGKLSIKPFGLILDIDLEKMNILKLLSTNSIFIELLRSNLFYNENVSANISINTVENIGSKFFDSSKVIFNINNGKINFNQSQLINNKIGTLKIIDSNLYFQNKGLIFYSDINIEVVNSNKFFSFFQTPKNYRKLIKNISVRMEYNFLEDQITLIDFKIDNIEPSEGARRLVSRFNAEKNNSLNNTILIRNLINKILIAYDG